MKIILKIIFISVLFFFTFEMSSSYSTGELLDKIDKLENRMYEQNNEINKILIHQDKYWNYKIEKNYRDGVKFASDGDSGVNANISNQLSIQSNNLTFWSVVITLLLGVGGWFIGNYISKKYEQVENIREELQKLRDDFKNEREKYFEGIQEEELKWLLGDFLFDNPDQIILLGSKLQIFNKDIVVKYWDDFFKLYEKYSQDHSVAMKENTFKEDDTFEIKNMKSANMNIFNSRLESILFPILNQFSVEKIFNTKIIDDVIKMKIGLGSNFINETSIYYLSNKAKNKNQFIKLLGHFSTNNEYLDMTKAKFKEKGEEELLKKLLREIEQKENAK